MWNKWCRVYYLCKKKGIEIIVIDHHEVKSLGSPLSIINPKLKGDTSNLNNLCTAGLVFLFVIGLNRELRKKNFFENKEETDLKEFLDIVAVGTICDLVPLQNENRLLVKKGLEKINLTPNKGLSVLKNIYKVRNIPCHIIQGRHDIICPPINAYKLSKIWSESILKIVEEGAHSGFEDCMFKQIKESINYIVIDTSR